MIERQTDQKLLKLRFDRGGEFMNNKFTAYLNFYGILRDLSTARNLQQNGVVERKYKSVVNTTDSMLIDGKLSTFLWAEAARTIVNLMNSTPTRFNEHVTLEEVFTGIKPNLERLRVCGYVTHIHQFRSDKLSLQSIKGAYLGNDSASKAYRVWVPTLRQVLITQDVDFDEIYFLDTL